MGTKVSEECSASILRSSSSAFVWPWRWKH